MNNNTKQKLLAKATSTKSTYKQFDHWLTLVDIDQPETQEYTMEWLQAQVRQQIVDADNYIEKLHKEETA